jgi:hypothetical protein
MASRTPDRLPQVYKIPFLFSWRSVDIISTAAKSTAIRENEGKLVLLSDAHYSRAFSWGFFPVVLRPDGRQKKFYEADVLVGRGKLQRRRFQYDDLTGLMVPSGGEIFVYHGVRVPTP